MTKFKSLHETPVNLVLANKPRGWIQFKGTDICMDVYCKCGTHSHIDGYFVYFIRCPNCNTVYELNGHIELIERNACEINKDQIQDTQI